MLAGLINQSSIEADNLNVALRGESHDRRLLVSSAYQVSRIAASSRGFLLFYGSKVHV
jgi:hypothetical protein